jgi:hypothetical protein
MIQLFIHDTSIETLLEGLQFDLLGGYLRAWSYQVLWSNVWVKFEKYKLLYNSESEQAYMRNKAIGLGESIS